MEAIILTKEQYDAIVFQLEEITKKLNKALAAKQETFMDNQEFLMLMKISKRTAQTWRDEGKVSFCQVGNKIYYKMSDCNLPLVKNT